MKSGASEFRDSSEVRDTSEFRATIALARQGSEEAFKVLVERYGVHVQRYVRRTIGQQLRAKVDEEDLQQMVWASFFNQRSRVVEFEESHAMVKYLVGIAANKVKSEMARYFADKRSLHRERSLEEPTLQAATGLADTPSQVVLRREAIEAVLGRFRARDQQIMRLWLQGSKYGEIAEHLGLDVSTVGKVVRKVCEYSQQWGKE